ncbi:glycogen synthase GlgA [Fusibacter paucivorans]|uniref:Glycogen synthase n=1 Tax=Fusibacter paucivorans TaxID=76009 RepID=A0ABS5PSA3_9FIRM|nr:glycogen synthase GlgA [Fusibacter paucivorans]MBS7527787.1 glycogen synthase GlgA [Fusibacter paucivorans]
MIQIAFIASEAAPFAKTGGLADVAGSLPKALNSSQLNVTVYLPLHAKIAPEYRKEMTFAGSTSVDLGWRTQYVGIFHLIYEGVSYFFIDNEFYFKRHQLYGNGDDAERYIYFSKAVLAAMKHLNMKPDIIHTNDWHTAAVNTLLNFYGKHDDFYQGIKSVFTIHNLRYQGIFDPYVLGDLLGLPMSYFSDDGLKFYENINLIKGGIVFSDAVTTVSKSYAEEIAYPYFGENLEGVIQKYQDKLYGIVNGIDTDLYSPKKDQNIPVNYDLRSLKRKKEIKMYLQVKYGLPVDANVPMLSMVTRLADMKGLDLIECILDELLELDIQFLVLGTGEKRYEDMFKYYQYRYPGKIAARIYFDQYESHAIYAGSDIFLMPSLFEPCGLSQLIALQYGTIPVVRQIGGLRDTILPYNKYTGEGTGFGFLNYNAHELLFTIKDALTAYQDQNAWHQLMKQAMKADHSWKRSSKEYLAIYLKILGIS